MSLENHYNLDTSEINWYPTDGNKEVEVGELGDLYLYSNPPKVFGEASAILTSPDRINSNFPKGTTPEELKVSAMQLAIELIYCQVEEFTPSMKKAFAEMLTDNSIYRRVE